MNQISIEVDDDTEKLLERLADEAGMSKSDFSRNALLDYVKKFPDGCITTLSVAKSA